MLYDQTTFVYNYTLSVAADVLPETNDKTHTHKLSTQQMFPRVGLEVMRNTLYFHYINGSVCA